jgi:hypothetical protein
MRDVLREDSWLGLAFLHIVISLFCVQRSQYRFRIVLQHFFPELCKSMNAPRCTLAITTYISPTVMASDFLPDGILLSFLIVD